jgi:hypothetical protein
MLVQHQSKIKYSTTPSGGRRQNGAVSRWNVCERRRASPPPRGRLQTIHWAVISGHRLHVTSMRPPVVRWLCHYGLLVLVLLVAPPVVGSVAISLVGCGLGLCAARLRDPTGPASGVLLEVVVQHLLRVCLVCHDRHILRTKSRRCRCS